MRAHIRSVGPPPAGTRLEAYDVSSLRTGSSVGIALILHGAFFLYAYLRPPAPAARQSSTIEMTVVQPHKTPPPVPAEVTPPPLPPQTESHKEPSRELPRALRPLIAPTEKPDSRSSAIEIPRSLTPPAEAPPGPPAKRFELFPENIGRAVGVPSPTAEIPRGENTLIYDPLRKVKKEPPFELVKEKGGGFKCETRAFVAHIAPDGKLTFDDRSFSFEKGNPGVTVDFGDMLSRAMGQDPYYAQKRKFREFSEEVRSKLREQAAQDTAERGLNTFAAQLSTIWNSRRSAATRRRELYEKWADCSDDPGDSTAKKGRHAVEDFVREHLPRSHADAFTDDEIARIAGERHGLPPFAPYND